MSLDRYVSNRTLILCHYFAQCKDKDENGGKLPAKWSKLLGSLLKKGVGGEHYTSCTPCSTMFTCMS